MSGLLKTFKAIQKIFPVQGISPLPGSTTRVSIGSTEAFHLDPFAFCVYFDIKVPVGFPDHPHLGSETITYMIDGQYDYEDSNGHKGGMKKGHLQWMTAGKGLVHAERPNALDSTACGFQIWMNLPLEEKYCEPEYQEFEDGDTPIANGENGVKVKVLAGEVLGVKSPTKLRNPGLYLDITMPPNSSFETTIPKGWNGFNYVFGGSAYYGEKKQVANTNDAVILAKDEGDILAISTKDQGARIFMASAQVCNEPIFNHNSMILPTQAEVDKEWNDFEHTQGRFSGVKGWESDIKKYLETFKSQDTIKEKLGYK